MKKKKKKKKNKKTQKKKRVQKTKKPRPNFNHDDFFKLVFSHPGVTQKLIELILSKEEREAFHLKKLKFEKDTHKKPEQNDFKESRLDLVISLPLKERTSEKMRTSCDLGA